MSQRKVNSHKVRDGFKIKCRILKPPSYKCLDVVNNQTLKSNKESTIQ